MCGSTSRLLRKASSGLRSWLTSQRRHGDEQGRQRGLRGYGCCRGNRTRRYGNAHANAVQHAHRLPATSIPPTATDTPTATATGTVLPTLVVLTDTSTATSTATEYGNQYGDQHGQQLAASPTICALPSPEPFQVEPVTSPTTQTSEVVTVHVGDGESVTVTSESGTFTANGNFSIGSPRMSPLICCPT